MTLLAIAEVLSGETLVSPGGPIDRDTAIADDSPLWAHDEKHPQANPEQPEQLELVSQPERTPVLAGV